MTRWVVFGDGFVERFEAEALQLSSDRLLFTVGGKTVAMFASGRWNYFMRLPPAPEQPAA